MTGQVKGVEAKHFSFESLIFSGKVENHILHLEFGLVRTKKENLKKTFLVWSLGVFGIFFLFLSLYL
jgi:hypothetical protein